MKSLIQFMLLAVVQAVVVITTLAFISVIGVGCASHDSAEAMPRKPQQSILRDDTGRFRVESHGYFFDEKFYNPHSIYIVDDTVTGKSYVVVTGAGICETPRKWHVRQSRQSSRVDRAIRLDRLFAVRICASARWQERPLSWSRGREASSKEKVTYRKEGWKVNPYESPNEVTDEVKVTLSRQAIVFVEVAALVILPIITFSTSIAFYEYIKRGTALVKLGDFLLHAIFVVLPLMRLLVIFMVWNEKKLEVLSHEEILRHIDEMDARRNHDHRQRLKSLGRRRWRARLVTKWTTAARWYRWR